MHKQGERQMSMSRVSGSGRSVTGTRTVGRNGSVNLRDYQLHTEYVSGNVVRKAEAVPAVKPEREERIWQEYSNAQKVNVRHKKNQMLLAQRANMVYTVALTAVVAVIFVICSQYLSLQSEMQANAAMVTKLQSQLNEMTAQNDEYEVNLKANVDYDAIYYTATKELGMVYPSKEQIITYDAGESEYVKQYADIPEAE